LIGGEVSEEDFIEHFLSASTHDNILFFTNKGKVFQTKVYEIPVGSRIAKGKLIQNFLEIPSDEKITAIVAYASTNNQKLITNNYLVMATKNGVIKKTALEDFSNVRRSGIIAVNLKNGDELRWVKLSSGKDEIILTTELGQSIRFKETKLRPMGRTASGVAGIRLKKNDFVSGFDIIKSEEKNQKLLIVMENGFAKQTPLKEYRLQNRGGSGIKTAKITSKTGKIVSARIIDSQEELLALSAKGQIIKTEVKSVRTCGRATSGVRIMKLKQGDKVAGIAAL
ncbi:MAG: DNA gyrase C-terminal beta-propeller domain-containing protein, partial [Patescibacteria group bacterium]